MKYLMIGGTHDGQYWNQEPGPTLPKLQLPKLERLELAIKTINAATTQPYDVDVYIRETFNCHNYSRVYYLHETLAVCHAIDLLFNNYKQPRFVYKENHES